jgi:DNA-binding NarL/FixJ family response regulator
MDCREANAEKGLALEDFNPHDARIGSFDKECSTWARGYVLKADASQDLVTAVHTVRGNQMFFIAKVAKMVLDGYLDKNPEGPDRDREKPVDIEATGNRAVLAEDKRSKEMAVALGLSAKTVETLRQQS